MEKKTKYKVSAVASLAVALVYVLVPTDIVPDIVPLAGWIDDVVAVLMAVANVLRLVGKMRKSTK